MRIADTRAPAQHHIHRSYDYSNAINNLVPQIAPTVTAKKGFLVLRPDSGDPVETVLMGLKAADKTFGSDVNKKGFKTPRGCSVLQGDGIDLETLKKILAAVEAEGFSALSVTFGMGGGLLQKAREAPPWAELLQSLSRLVTVLQPLLLPCPAVSWLRALSLLAATTRGQSKWRYGALTRVSPPPSASRPAGEPRHHVLRDEAVPHPLRHRRAPRHHEGEKPCLRRLISSLAVPSLPLLYGMVIAVTDGGSSRIPPSPRRLR